MHGHERAVTCAPRVGDVLRLRAAKGTAAEKITGVVLAVRVRQDGVWTHAQLALNGSLQWVSKSTIAVQGGE